MDINYRILWVEDIEEWYESQAENISSYLKSKEYICQIKWYSNLSGLIDNEDDLDKYDIIVVDYQLNEGKEKYGDKVIEYIREKNCISDVLFYSSQTVVELNQVMQKNNLQGVFTCDRHNKNTCIMLERLIDKSIRRADSPCNIRGIVMDKTSDFDTQMKNIANEFYSFLSSDNKQVINKYIRRIFKDEKLKNINSIISKLEQNDLYDISKIISSREFDSNTKARLLSTLIDDYLDSDERSKLFSKFDMQTFYHKYKEEIIDIRNALAHGIKSDNNKDYYIEFRDKKVECNSDFCKKMRQSLIYYHFLFKDLESLCVYSRA